MDLYDFVIYSENINHVQLVQIVRFSFKNNSQSINKYTFNKYLNTRRLIVL